MTQKFLCNNARKRNTMVASNRPDGTRVVDNQIAQIDHFQCNNIK